MTATAVETRTPLAHQAPDEPRHRVGFVAGTRHSLTLAWRGIMHIKHDPEQVIDLLVQPIVFTLLFVYIFGGAISGSTQDYLQFALPGLIVQTGVFASMGTGFNLNRDIEKGIFDRFRSLPIARPAPLVGLVMSDIVRYTVSIAVMVGFGIVLGFRVGTNPLWAVAACALILLFVLAVCWISVFVGLVAKSPQSVQVFGFMVIFPLTFGSNVFAPTDSMPGWLQAWVKINPVSLLSDAARGLMVDGPIAAPAIKAMLWGIGIVAVFAPLAMAQYRRRLGR